MRLIPALTGLLVAGALSLATRAEGARVSPCDLTFPSDTSVAWTCVTIRKDESLESLFGDRWMDVARFNRIDRRHASPGLRIRVPQRLDAIECFSPMPQRYALADSESQFVLIHLSEQFLGAYEHGRRVFSAPITTGRTGDPTPTGLFRITAYDRNHHSSRYRIAQTNRPYPMHYGLRFHVDASGVSYWIHGRDVPGVAASHGCIGLYDEAMQKQCYGQPDEPALADARWLFEWVVGSQGDTTSIGTMEGPRVLIVGSPPKVRIREVERPIGGNGNRAPDERLQADMNPVRWIELLCPQTVFTSWLSHRASERE